MHSRVYLGYISVQGYQPVHNIFNTYQYKCVSVTQFLYCRDTAGPPLRGGDLGTYQEDGGCPGRVPGQGSTAADGAHATPWEGRKVAVPPPGLQKVFIFSDIF